MARHVVHRAVESRRQPFAQPGFRVAQIDSGHPDLGESKLLRPSPQLSQQLLPVQGMTLLHPPILETRHIVWSDQDDCAAFAARLAQRPVLRNAFLELRGELGAGKTTFVRHLLHALGVVGRIKSPTYTVLEAYELPGCCISHFDFYRFDDAREWDDAGFREIFAAPGLKLVEWPQHAEGRLPVPDLRLDIAVADETRREVTLQAFTPLGVTLAA